MKYITPQLLIRKIVLLLVLLQAMSTQKIAAQENSLGAPYDFMSLIIQMNKELVGPKTVGSWEMLQNLRYKIDDELSHKYLLEGNQKIKQEDSECYPIGFTLNRKDGVATFFYFRGPATNTIFYLDIKTFDVKTGKVIDQLSKAASFKEENGACNLFVQNFNLAVIKTFADNDLKEFEIKFDNKGKIIKN